MPCGITLDIYIYIANIGHYGVARVRTNSPRLWCPVVSTLQVIPLSLFLFFSALLSAFSLMPFLLRHSPTPLGHSSWSDAPNYTSRVTDENRGLGKTSLASEEKLGAHRSVVPRITRAHLVTNVVTNPILSLSSSLFLSFTFFPSSFLVKLVFFSRERRLFYTALH